MGVEIDDVLGIKPASEAGLELTKASINGISSFLEAVCKPALQELGFLAQDKIRKWRLNNIVHTLEKAQGRMYFDGKDLQLTANAQVGLSIMEGCSQVDNDELQDLWAGLFVSSCTIDGKDDSNMNFVDLLKRMSSVEAKIIEYACVHSKKILYKNKLLCASRLKVSFGELTKIAGIDDVYRLDSELDHMRSILLLETGNTFVEGGGFSITDEKLEANITPSPLALTLYFKTHSAGISPVEFWKNDIEPYNEKESIGPDI